MCLRGLYFVVNVVVCFCFQCLLFVVMYSIVEHIDYTMSYYSILYYSIICYIILLYYVIVHNMMCSCFMDVVVIVVMLLFLRDVCLLLCFLNARPLPASGWGWDKQDRHFHNLEWGNLYRDLTRNSPL